MVETDKTKKTKKAKKAKTKDRVASRVVSDKKLKTLIKNMLRDGPLLLCTVVNRLRDAGVEKSGRHKTWKELMRQLGIMVAPKPNVNQTEMYAFMPGMGLGGPNNGDQLDPRHQTTKKQDEVPWTRKKLRQRVLSCLKDRSRMLLSELGQEIPKTARGGRPLRTVLSGLGDFVLTEGIPPIWWVSLKRSSKTAETEKTEKVKTKKKHVAVHVQEERSCTELLTPAQLILWNEVEQFVGQVLSTDK